MRGRKEGRRGSEEGGRAGEREKEGAQVRGSCAFDRPC